MRRDTERLRERRVEEWVGCDDDDEAECGQHRAQHCHHVGRKTTRKNTLNLNTTTADITIHKTS